MAQHILLRPDPLEEKLCLYAACLNTLDSDEKRRAFAEGDENFSGKKFKQFITEDIGRISSIDKDFGKDLRKAKKVDGYNSRDMLKWLCYLKKENHICNFSWHAIKIPKREFIDKKGVKIVRRWNPDQMKSAKRKGGYILFGYAMTSTDRDKMSKKMSACKNDHNKKVERFNNSKAGKRYSHGISVATKTINNITETYVYDNGCKVPKKYSIESLASRIDYPFKVFIFDITV